MAVSSFVYPDIIPSVSGFNVMTPTELEINGINGVEHITENSGERWYIELKYSILARPEALEILAHLQRLQGSTNISLIKDLGFTNRGTWAGTPLVNGNDEHGLEVDADGFLQNSAIGRVCDRIKIGDRVHSLVEDFTTTSNTGGTLELANEIINIPADNTAIITDPSLLTIRARWLDPSQIRQFQGNKSYIRNVSLTFVESLA